MFLYYSVSFCSISLLIGEEDWYFLEFVTVMCYWLKGEMSKFRKRPNVVKYVKAREINVSNNSIYLISIVEVPFTIFFFLIGRNMRHITRKITSNWSDDWPARFRSGTGGSRRLCKLFGMEWKWKVSRSVLKPWY